MYQEIHKASTSPTRAIPAAAKDPTVRLAAPVNGDEPVPIGAAGAIGDPVADGPDPDPEPEEPVPVGNGAPVPVANPVEPAM